MKIISKFLMALMVIVALSVTGCRDTKKEEVHDNHGHSHDDGSDHSHEHEEVKQEEFTVGNDTVESKENMHTHDNGEEHHAH